LPLRTSRSIRESVAVRIYLDSCCLNRPFDDLANPRIRLEAEAVLAILAAVRSGRWEVLASEALDMELARTPDEQRRRATLEFLRDSREHIRITDSMVSSAERFKSAGFGAFDALHIACAIEAKADFLLTVDDPMLRRAKRVLPERPCRFHNPVEFLMEHRGIET